MEGMIKAMSSDEKVGMALFYSAQKTLGKSAVSPALAAAGKIYYDKICFRCHGETGHGSDKFARIAGQQPGYLKHTLIGYRSGTGARIDPLMASNTKLMSDSDIDSVVAYVSSMP
jgi:cytochrome c553